jgi:hypothetical protein
VSKQSAITVRTLPETRFLDSKPELARRNGRFESVRLAILDNGGEKNGFASELSAAIAALLEHRGLAVNRGGLRHNRVAHFLHGARLSVRGRPVWTPVRG